MKPHEETDTVECTHGAGDATCAPEGKREARARAQRNRILDAAQRCFAERGFHGAGMAMIADTAQMSPGLIYRYFAGKSELIHGIVSRHLEWMAEDVETFKTGGQDPESLIVDRFSAAGQMAADDDVPMRMLPPALVLEIVAESGRDPVIAAALDALNREVDAALGDFLARPPSQGGLGIPSERLPARILMLRCLLDGLIMHQAGRKAIDRVLTHEALTIAFRGMQSNS